VIDQLRIRAALAERGIEAHVEAQSITGSTNDDAKKAASLGMQAPAIFVADEQTHGRGRGGNDWLSRPGEGVLMSVLVRPAIAPSASAPLTLAIGVAVAEVIERRAGPRVLIKWPNDVLLDRKKIAGILVEGQIRADKLASVIIGVGLNVHAATLPNEIATIATSLAIAGVEHRDRSELIAELALSIIESVELFARVGLAAFIDRARSRDALLGHPIEVGELIGIADGIDEQGRLLILRSPTDRVAVASGHVIPRARLTT
jgi:BirA family biotin operon repressor/biotin-[acetyl-CoA-carboxylase] ligase